MTETDILMEQGHFADILKNRPRKHNAILLASWYTSFLTTSITVIYRQVKHKLRHIAYNKQKRLTLSFRIRNSLFPLPSMQLKTCQTFLV